MLNYTEIINMIKLTGNNPRQNQTQKHISPSIFRSQRRIKPDRPELYIRVKN